MVNTITVIYRYSLGLAKVFPRMDDDSLDYIVSVIQHSIEQWEREIE